MTVAHATSPYITTYKRSGDTFTKLSNPSVLPATTATAARWSPDGTHLAVSVGAGAGQFGRILYKREADVLTAIDTAYTSKNSVDVTWSSDGIYLALTTDASSYIYAFKSAIFYNRLTLFPLPLITTTPTARIKVS